MGVSSDSSNTLRASALHATSTANMFKGRPTETDEMASQDPPSSSPPPAVASPPAADLADIPTQSTYSYSESSPSTMGQEPEIVEAHEEKRLTDSHHLADMAAKERPIEERGHAEMSHEEVEVKNLGWNSQAQKVAQPMIGGLTNEELWILVRRFDKVGHGMDMLWTSASVMPLVAETDIFPANIPRKVDSRTAGKSPNQHLSE